ncbi:hypothetical protein SAMD00019534_069290 [Acytostelium subglobosum LB1]|uniref:hypothetical protein n=1 Tax=Acytostelium subglobosum LB1 TaxID=1410327 RepID=UPI0006450DFC|nr:hypothetical protein SAMD00019534_069290 [Acytostelium subglobosum LB1]GAM23754.1 hypothetical protein SAMD00019534_069290 [Acytostelium subglobosum LB1]|eukprot:XP_012753495.1 hypothetical protein SAMD00019534_069290 [Acytostelium subglobosum LB1]
MNPIPFMSFKRKYLTSDELAPVTSTSSSPTAVSSSSLSSSSSSISSSPMHHLPLAANPAPTYPFLDLHPPPQMPTALSSLASIIAGIGSPTSSPTTSTTSTQHHSSHSSTSRQHHTRSSKRQNISDDHHLHLNHGSGDRHHYSGDVGLRQWAAAGLAYPYLAYNSQDQRRHFEQSQRIRTIKPKLNYFKAQDLRMTSLVSREWSRISFISTTELYIDNHNSPSSEELISKRICKHSDYLKKIRCASTRSFGFVSIDTIIAHCHHLVDIQFYQCPAILDAQVELVCARLLHLRRLILHSDQLTSKTIDALALAKELRELELGGFSRLHPESFAKIGACQSLLSLDVSGIDLDVDFVRHLASCTTLRSLRLRIASEQSISRLPYLANLTTLSIAEWELNDDANNDDNKTNLLFLTRLDALVKLELASAICDPPMVIGDLSSIMHSCHTLRELDLDISYHLTEDTFVQVFQQLQALESLFLSSFNLSGNSWRGFSSLPRLKYLSMCCNFMDEQSINTGLVHLGQCRQLERFSIINSTQAWVTISAINFRSLLKCRDLSQLRLGGSRGGGWILDESIFAAIGNMKMLQHLDTTNSRGITEKCFEHLSQCTSLESLECGIKVSEETVGSAVAEWCGTGTLVNCPMLKKVVVDVRLPSLVNSEITCNTTQSTTNSGFNLIAKLAP